MSVAKPNPTPALARPAALLLALAIATGLAGCGVPVPMYRMDIQQGNVITQEMVNRLEPGMDRRQVRFILGTPLVEDSFHPNRWDYYYSFKDGARRAAQRRVTLYFENERLARVEGDVRLGAQRQPVQPDPERIVVVPDQQGPGLLSVLTPSFLKRDKREDALEKSRPEVDEAAKQAGAAAAEEVEGTEPAAPFESAEQPDEDVAVARPLPSSAAPPGDPEESEYFRQLFRGYGRPGGEASAGPPLVPPAAPPAEDTPPAEAETPPSDAPGAVADAEQPAEEASEEEKGFFSNLVKKLRKERDGDEPEAEDPQPSPAVLVPGVEEEGTRELDP